MIRIVLEVTESATSQSERDGPEPNGFNDSFNNYDRSQKKTTIALVTEKQITKKYNLSDDSDNSDNASLDDVLGSLMCRDY